MNKALLVGVNQYAAQTPLNGCINDVIDVKAALIGRSIVQPSEAVSLCDSDATKPGILAALTTLVESLGKGDRGYFHFSGHGVRMPSTDLNEPDGLDEVLCPYEFDWTPDTAITDNELLQVLGSLKLGARLIMTIDSCHSGDFTRMLLARSGRPRTLVPPPGMRIPRGASKQGFRALGRAPNVTFVSAVMPWQVAADTSFEGRPNGAFTYYFLKEVDVSSAPVSDVVVAIEPSLRLYEMTPIAEGAETPYFVSPAPKAGIRSLTLAPPAPAIATRTLSTRAASVVFEQYWHTNFVGQQMGIAVRISALNGELSAYVSTTLMGKSHTSPPIRISGNLTCPIVLGFFGVSLELSISDWRYGGQAIDFVLGLALTSSLLFVPRVQVARVPVHIEVGELTRDLTTPAVTSPSDLLALLTLQQMTSSARFPTEQPREPSTIRTFRDPRIQVVAADVAGWGPNWREDRVIRPFVDRPRPDGITRHSVDIGPQRGSGNVYVVGWLSDQETDFDFVLHMGNHFFGGWGDIDWRVQGIYADVQPFPRIASESRSETKGSTHPSGYELPAVERRPPAYNGS